ncbi:hypothetical protein D3C72_2293760 [compost metagenome]
MAVPVLHAAVLPGDEDQFFRSRTGYSALLRDLQLRRAEVRTDAQPGQLHDARRR